LIFCNPFSIQKISLTVMNQHPAKKNKIKSYKFPSI